MKIVYLNGTKPVKPKKLTAKQEFEAFADKLREKWERRDRINAEKEYPKYLEEARERLRNQKL